MEHYNTFIKTELENLAISRPDLTPKQRLRVASDAYIPKTDASNYVIFIRDVMAGLAITHPALNPRDRFYRASASWNR
jgi:hypothetical protein